MKKKLLGLGLGVVMSAAVVALPTAAFADTTCYVTGCSQSQGGVTPQVVSTPPAVAPVEPQQAASGGLPFTGADIEEMAAVGAGALLVGGALVRRSRRHSRAAA
jgi:hypothetical protein